jgi:hypothetical protein
LQEEIAAEVKLAAEEELTGQKGLDAQQEQTRLPEETPRSSSPKRVKRRRSNINSNEAVIDYETGLRAMQTI